MYVFTDYEQMAYREMDEWRRDMQRRPGLFGSVGHSVQQKINDLIPEKVHAVITSAFKVITQFLLKGADFITSDPLKDVALNEREAQVKRKIELYKGTATAEGAITGAGGILLGLADLPLWLTIKIKMLSHMAALYGYDTGDFKERLYILHVLSLTFSGRKHRRKVYSIINNWDAYVRTLPETEEAFDWHTFQQEYRDYLDIAKLLQLIPGIGAAVGALVNHKLTDRLGSMAMNAYRMRYFAARQVQPQSNAE
jgi:uncharacterized protein (DUF697 family)